MKKNYKKRAFKPLAGFVFVFFLLVPLRIDLWSFGFSHATDNHSVEREVINQDTTWSGEMTTDKRFIVKKGATLTVISGSKIHFKKESTLKELPGVTVEEGQIIAEGNLNEPIVFSSDEDEGFSFNFLEESLVKESFFRYVTFERGGGQGEAILTGSLIDRFKNKANAVLFDIPTIQYSKGKVHIENSKFTDGDFGDISFRPEEFDWENEDNFYRKDNHLQIVNSNFQEGKNKAIVSGLQCNALSDFNDFMECLKKFTLAGNYYDDFGGPKVTEGLTSGGHGDKKEISGQFYFPGLEENPNQKFWRIFDLIADPVVIIPGIMGSAQKDGNWEVDPILHTYDDLIESLQANNFESDKNLFLFPYDWRKSNLITADHLAEKVLQIKNQTLVSKVDLVAHSMGGLVARAYIQGENYEGDPVDQLITLGTPHRGAPEAYLKWEATEGFFDFGDKMVKRHFENEAEHNGYKNLFDYIRAEVSSIEELLPDYDYLFDVQQNKIRSYPQNYPRNEFLENLNLELELQKLEKVDFTNIIGEEEIENTIAKIRLTESTVDNRWLHGMPEDFYNEESDKGLEYEKGDRTVPSFSALNIMADRKISKNVKHSKLPTQSQCEILAELTNKKECFWVDKHHIPNILLLNLFSPIDVQVVAPDGKRVGKDFETKKEINEIEDAFYSGFETQSEFVTIPNPLDGEYQILTQGTGEGEFRIEAVSISENEGTKETEEEIQVTEGTATEGVIQEETVLIEEGKVTGKEKDKIPPTISVFSPESKEYLNHKEIHIDFEATDDVSALENITIEKTLDQKIITKEVIDLSLLSLGDHQFSLQATDEADNVSLETVTFSTTTNLQSLKKNIKHYDELGFFEKKWQKRFYLNYLNHLNGLIHHKNFLEKYFKNNKRKEKISKIFNRIIERKFDHLIRIVKNHEKRNWIRESAGERMIEGLEHVRNGGEW